MRLTGTTSRPSSLELALDRARDRDQLVHLRRELGEERLVLGRADPARVDGRDDVRPALAGLAEGDDRAGPDDLGPVHVGVDDVGADLGEVRRERADRDRVVRLVDDEDRDAGPLELADGAAGRQRDDRDVVAGRVEPGDQRVEVLLGAAVRAGREHLDDADRGRRRAAGGSTGVEAGIERQRARSSGRSAGGTSRRWIGSSTGAPLVLVRLVAAQEVEPALAGRERPLDVGVDHHARPARARARPGRRRRCSRGSRRASRSGCRPRSAGRRRVRNVRRSGPSAPASSNRRRKKTRLWSPPGVSAGRGPPRPSASGGGR